MSDMLAKVKVILQAAVTWLVAISVAVTAFADQLGELGGESAHGAIAVALKIGAWLGAAIAIIRRVTPVLPEERGILPAPSPQPGDADQPSA